MLSYTHFTHDERISLHNFLKEGLGIREIARRLGRDPSTISREVKRNSSSKGYHHRRAQVLTISRRRQQRRTALKPGTPQYDYTLEKLRNMWPPEAIANRFRLENPGQILSTSTIYRAICLLRFCRQHRHRSTASSAPHLREATAVWFGQQYRYRATAINVSAEASKRL